MRWLLIFFVIAGQLCAQERSRLDQILEADRHKTYQGKGFESGKTAETKSKGVQPFSFISKVFSKPFGTKNYSGGKEYTTGDFTVVSARSAQKSAREAQKQAATKSMATSEFDQRGRVTETRSYGTDSYKGGPGRSQQRFDAEGPSAQAGSVGWKGKLEPMTIDDVRELLNKSK